MDQNDKPGAEETTAPEQSSLSVKFGDMMAEIVMMEANYSRTKLFMWLSLALNVFLIVIMVMVFKTFTWKSEEYVAQLEKENGTIIPVLLSNQNDLCEIKKGMGLPIDQASACAKEMAAAETDPVVKGMKRAKVPVDSVPAEMKFYGKQADENLRQAQEAQKNQQEEVDPADDGSGYPDDPTDETDFKE